MMDHRCYRLLLSVALVGLLQDRVSAEIFSFSTDATRIVGQSTSPVASTTVANESEVIGGDRAVARFGLNVNADDSAGAGFVPEIGSAIYRLSFQLIHSPNYNLLLDFLPRGSLTRVSDALGCAGSVSFSDITIGKMVRVGDNAEFPIDVTFSGQEIESGGGDASLEFPQEGRRVGFTIRDRTESFSDQYFIDFSMTASVTVQLRSTSWCSE